MKLSELIHKLQFLQNRVGDTNVHFVVRDYFSNNMGQDATFDLKVGETTGLPTDHENSFTSGDHTTFVVSLKPTWDCKKPKITYRQN